MNYTSELFNKPKGVIKTVPVNDQNTPICMSGIHNQTSFCGLLDETGSSTKEKQTK